MERVCQWGDDAEGERRDAGWGAGGRCWDGVVEREEGGRGLMGRKGEGGRDASKMVVLFPCDDSWFYTTLENDLFSCTLSPSIRPKKKRKSTYKPSPDPDPRTKERNEKSNEKREARTT